MVTREPCEPWHRPIVAAGLTETVMAKTSLLGPANASIPARPASPTPYTSTFAAGPGNLAAPAASPP
jgi:hypothetical protein